MSILIRPARPEDAPGIEAVKQRVWPNESSDESRIIHILRQPDHITQVAVTDDGAVAGFVDGFLTWSQEDVTRWEVDLLAVAPDFQGQKIGQRLIQAATEAGWEAGADLARALVQIRNYPSQGAMRRCGFATDERPYWLMTSAKKRKAGGSLDQAALIAVDTLNYAGLWLEGSISPTALEAAQAAHTRHGGDLVGTLIPADEVALLAAAETLGYQRVECFQWWIKRQGSSI